MKNASPLVSHSSCIHFATGRRAALVAAAVFAGAASLSSAAVTGYFEGAGTGNTGTNSDYSNAANWYNGVVPSGSGDTAVVVLGSATTPNTTSGTGSLAMVLDEDVSLGTFQLTSSSSGQNFSLAGSGTSSTSTLTFDNGSSTPQLLLNTWFNKTYSFGGSGLTFAGTSGLNVTTGSNVFFMASGMSWTGFSGTLTLTPGGTNNPGTLDEISANLLPSSSDLNLNATGTGNTEQLGLFAGRNQTIGALIGTSASYLENNSSSTTNTVLTLGNNNDSGTFAGTIGKVYNAGAATFDSNISITKVGSGTERFTGISYAGGTTTIGTNTTTYGGTLLVDGTHTATISSGNAAATTGTGGLYVVNDGTLGGTGTIQPFDTAGGGYAIAVNAAGVIDPGDSQTSNGIGTLTLNNTTSLRTVLGFNSTSASLLYDLGANLASDDIALIGKSGVATVYFDSTTINFNDLTNGSLSSGQYMLFSGDSNTTYRGLTESGDGTITGGLTVGSGLSDYSYSLQQVGQNIVLNVAAVPEPASVGLLAGLGVSLAGRRRRRY